MEVDLKKLEKDFYSLFRKCLYFGSIGGIFLHSIVTGFFVRGNIELLNDEALFHYIQSDLAGIGIAIVTVIALSEMSLYIFMNHIREANEN